MYLYKILSVYSVHAIKIFSSEAEEGSQQGWSAVETKLANFPPSPLYVSTFDCTFLNIKICLFEILNLFV